MSACHVKSRLCTVQSLLLTVWLPHLVQVNARKIYDEANVFGGVVANKLFTAILLGEATLQVCVDPCGGKRPSLLVAIMALVGKYLHSHSALLCL